MSAAHHPSKKKMPQMQVRSGGVPPAWEWKAANSLYRFAATVDEGAAGRPEVQEGRAGCSGRSGLATGTENRKEMKRGKRGRDSTAGREGGEEGGKTQGRPPGDTFVVGQSQQEGLQQQMLLLLGVDCMKDTGPWLWQEVEKGTMPRPQLLHRGHRAGRRESPRAGRVRSREHQRPGIMPMSPSAWNQHKCRGEPSLVPSRARKQGRCALKKGWKG